MSFIPNTTPTPNWLYNGEMKKMSDTELRVVLIITRATLGWIEKNGTRKDRDWISQKYFMEKSGKSNRAISTAIESCLQHGWIEAYDKSEKELTTPENRSGKRVYYRLGNMFRKKITSENISQVSEPVNLTTETSELNDTKPVNLLHSTKETLTKETIQKELAEQAPPISLKEKKKLTDIQSLVEHFQTKFVELIDDTPPEINFPKIGKLAKPYLVKYGLEKMKELADRYFYTDNKFYREVAWSMDIFLTSNVIHSLNHPAK